MKSTRFNRFVGLAALAILPGSLFAADITRNDTANELVSDEAWIDTVAPGASDRAVWNSDSVGGATTLGGDASWQGILISSGTPSSGPLFTTAVNPNSHTLSLGAGGINLNNGGNTNRGITFDSNTKLDLTANQTWSLGLGQSAANIVVSSVISGTGALAITRDAASNNLLQLSGANTFSGGFTLNPNAIVTVGVAAVISAGTTTSSALGSYDGTQFLTLNGGRINSGNFSFHARDAKIAGDFTFATTARTEFRGNYDLQNGTRTMTLTRSATAANTVIQGGNVALRFSEASVLTSFGNGTLRIAADAAITPGTFVPVIANSGTAFTTNAGLTLGPKVIYSAGTGGLNVASAVPSVTLEAGSFWNLAEGATATPRNPQVNSLAGAGTVLPVGTATAGTAFTLTIRGNSGTVSDFSGSVVNSDTTTFATSTVGIVGVTKLGSTTQIFSGSNSYSGKTTISGGTLQFAKQVSLYNNTPASWTDANLQVDSNAVLALNVGGSGEFTSSNIASLTALGTASGGFRSGSKLGLDTTNAGGSFTYGSVLANPNAGANALGLRKLGTGTLVLDQINTYTGGTIVEGGTLRITQPAGLGTGAVVVNAGTTVDADFSGLGAAGKYERTTTGTGTITATPPNISQFSFTSLTLTNFAGTINVKPSPASNGRVDFNGLIGSGSILNIENGATARLANSTATYSGITINVTGQGGSGPGALRLQDNTLDSTCAVNLLGDASIGSFIVTSVIDAVIADGGNGYSLTKSGDSTLVLTATNTYTGDTNVNGGTLRISKPYLANASDIVIGAAAILDLNFDESGGAVSDTVSTLTIDGVQQAAGVYGATGSGAPMPNDTHFAGSGTLTVLNGPAPAGGFATWASANGIAGQPFDGDFDNDGLSNGVEYALGKSPTVSSQPPGTLAGNILTFTKGADAIASSDVSWVIETSTTLAAGSWTAEVTQAPGDAAATIGYTFTPGTPVKKFARLKVVQNP
jgi:autotransporter-associated beta strand protein